MSCSGQLNIFEKTWKHSDGVRPFVLFLINRFYICIHCFQEIATTSHSDSLTATKLLAFSRLLNYYVTKLPKKMEMDVLPCRLAALDAPRAKPAADLPENAEETQKRRTVESRFVPVPESDGTVCARE